MSVGEGKGQKGGCFYIGGTRGNKGMAAEGKQSRDRARWRSGHTPPLVDLEASPRRVVQEILFKTQTHPHIHILSCKTGR